MSKNSMLLYGKNSVLERLKADPETIRRIFLRDNFDGGNILDIIKSKNIPVVRLDEKKFSKIKHAERIQGIIAEIDRFSYINFRELLNRPKDEQLSLIFLDNINDPHNLGSIMRSLACLGGFAMVIPKHNSCEVNETVLHVASGGENFVPVSMVTNLSTALIEAKKAGYWAIGATVEGGEDITKASLPFPVCLVMGSEGKGLRYGIDKQLELKVSLPMEGAGLSFNVGVACAILCHEIVKQRSK